MRQSSLLIFNTALLFSRMVLTFGIGIYCTRLLVQLLGHADFGLLSALGASGTLLLITSRSLESSSQRHLAHAIGSGNRDQLGKVFANTLAVFAGLAACLLTVTAAAAPGLLGALNIPPERERAAVLVYLFTMLGLAVTTLGIPFRSVFAAHQEMAAVASFETWRSLLNLACALAMLASDRDRLVVYAGAKFVSTLLQSGANTPLRRSRQRRSASRACASAVSARYSISRSADWSYSSNPASVAVTVHSARAALRARSPMRCASSRARRPPIRLRESFAPSPKSSGIFASSGIRASATCIPSIIFPISLRSALSARAPRPSKSCCAARSATRARPRMGTRNALCRTPGAGCAFSTQWIHSNTRGRSTCAIRSCSDPSRP